jgi:hypothetical protein
MITGQLLRSIIFTLTLFHFALCVRAQTFHPETPDLIDARQWDFSKRLPLKGTWRFFENQLLTPREVAQHPSARYTSFPVLWNDHRVDGKGIGYATYTLTVLVPDSLSRFALEIPQMYSSYSLWVNGKLTTTAGIVTKEKETAIPQWTYKTVSFSNTGDTVQLVLQLANFHHFKGGAKDPIYLGTTEKISSHFRWAVGSNVVEAAVLLAEGIFFLMLYFRKRKIVILYFALLCITWSLRSIFSNLYPIILVAPNFDWQWMVKIEYLTLYLMAIWAALFFHSLFKDISNEIFTFLPITLNLFFVAFTLVTPAIFFSRWVSLYLGVELLVIVYGATMIIRSLIMEREGSGFLLVSLSVGVLIFGYDIAAYQSSFSYNVVLMNVGYLLIFFFTTLGLIFQLRMAGNTPKYKDKLSYSDLFQDVKKMR